MALIPIPPEPVPDPPGFGETTPRMLTHANLEANLDADIAAMQAIIETPNATLSADFLANPAPYLKDVARMLRRVGKLQRGGDQLDSA